MELLLITTRATPQDKEKCLAVVELLQPSRNADLERHALELHQTYGFDAIYTKQEDLLLRAAYLREYLGIQGLQPHQVTLFRNKYLMKETLQQAGLHVGPFALVKSPCDILAFYQKYKKIVVKPIMGSASQGVHVIATDAELQEFLESRFFQVTNQLEYHSEWMVEQFLGGTMYHVNGVLQNGKLKGVWAFQYLNTNLGFTKGTYYGNASLLPMDSMYQRLIEITEKILAALPPIQVFHLELFHTHDQLLVCEIAARRPGGSIGLLIQQLTEPNFPRIEFRINNQLPIDFCIKPEYLGDVMIPKPIGRLTKIPNEYPGATIYAKEGQTYTGFDINHLNTMCRIVCSAASFEELVDELHKRTQHFLSLVEYT
jgi:biotin carboxylase